jgi:hypothetical protein
MGRYLAFNEAFAAAYRCIVARAGAGAPEGQGVPGESKGL